MKELIVFVFSLIVLISFSTAFAAEHQSITELGDQAMNAIQSSDFEKAIEIFDKILEIDPQNIAALHNKATALLQLEKYDQSIEIYDKILQIAPESKDALKNRNVAFQKIGITPIKDSKYLAYVIIQVHNKSGELVGVVIADNISYSPNSLTDEFLDAHPVKEIMEINGHNFEKREIITSFNAQEDTFISSARLVSEKFGDTIVIFFTLNHAYTVERGDIATAFWTVLRAVS